MWSVENGVVISGFNKDCEVISWNEQGEITRVEGMFIIDFLLFLPCSHIDSKLINLMIKIHYMINMSYDSDFPIKRTKGFEYGQHGIKRNKELDDLIDKICEKLELKEHALMSSCAGELSPSFFYSPDKVLKEVGAIKNERDQLREELNNLRIEFDERISKLENEKNKEIKELKQTVLQLREIIGKKHSDWQIDWDMAWRKNPVTKKIEPYGFPPDFDETKVKNVHFTDEEGYMCHFKYFFSDKEDDFKEWDMPFHLLKALPSLLKKKGKAVSSKIIKNLELKDKKEIRKILDESGENIDDLDYLDTVIDFLWERKGKKFGTNDFQRESKISSSSTVQIYLKMLVRCDIIIFLKKGWYKINIK